MLMGRALYVFRHSPHNAGQCNAAWWCARDPMRPRATQDEFPAISAPLATRDDAPGPYLLGAYVSGPTCQEPTFQELGRQQEVPRVRQTD